MPGVFWLVSAGLLLLGLLAGFWLGKKRTLPAPPPAPPEAKPTPKEAAARQKEAQAAPVKRPEDPPSGKFALPNAEAELLGEAETSTKHDLFAKIPVVWDGSPQSSPRPSLARPFSSPSQENPPKAELSGSWQLVFAAGEAPCKDFVLNRSRLRVGRREGSDIHISDNGISKAHADVLMLQEGPAVIDLGSSNGTWLNGAQIPSGEPIPLQDGDRVAFSSFVFTVAKKKL